MSAALPSPPLNPANPSHHRRRFIVHRVRESLKKRATKFLCALFLSILLAAALLLFLFILRPRFHVSSFSFPFPAASHPISFVLSDRNLNREIGFYYDSMFGSVYYGSNRIGFVPALISPFYQQPKNTTLVG